MFSAWLAAIAVAVSLSFALAAPLVALRYRLYERHRDRLAPLERTPLRSEDALIEDIRARAGTVFHPVGTCGMGPDPATSVVDPRLRVHGVQGLRIVDASIFPVLPSGNTNAPTIMVGEKGADLILADAR